MDGMATFTMKKSRTIMNVPVSMTARGAHPGRPAVVVVAARSWPPSALTVMPPASATRPIWAITCQVRAGPTWSAGFPVGDGGDHALDPGRGADQHLHRVGAGGEPEQRGALRAAGLGPHQQLVTIGGNDLVVVAGGLRDGDRGGRSVAGLLGDEDHPAGAEGLQVQPAGQL